MGYKEMQPFVYELRVSLCKSTGNSPGGGV